MLKHSIVPMVLTLAFLHATRTQSSAGRWFVSEDVSALAAGTTSIAVDGAGRPWVAFYATNGDLRLARRTGGAWTVDLVDGAASNAGQWCSLAISANGTPSISYYDASVQDLKYARRSGASWVIQTVDATGDVGAGTSLVLDNQGDPHIAYTDNTNGNLKYARQVAGVWTRETADGSADAVGASQNSIALDHLGNPHIAYISSAPASYVRYARKSLGVWVTEIVDGIGGFTGFFSAALDLDPQDRPHLIYYFVYNVNDTELWYARKFDGAWERIFQEFSTNGGGGPATDLVVDSQGAFHFVYFKPDYIPFSYPLIYSSSFAYDIVEYPAIGSGRFEDCALALDRHGNAHVSYRQGGKLLYTSEALRFVSPAAGVAWPVGSQQTVEWTGAGPASLLLSTDGGSTYQLLRDSIERSPLAIRVPHTPTRFGRFKVVRENPYSEAVTDSFFTINATIALVDFAANSTPEGDHEIAALAWRTEPAPPEIAGYRLEMALSTGTSQEDRGDFRPLHEGLLLEGAFTHRVPSGAREYRLIAVNGLDEEFVLSQRVIGSGASLVDRLLSIAPNPARDGLATIRFRAPAVGIPVSVEIFDVTGRRVVSLASDVSSTTPVAIAWDGANDRGERLAPGTYFARLSSRRSVLASEKVVVAR